ncbi:MAG: GGDEF domain-containing protein [Oscillospiraceae bacterium]
MISAVLAVTVFAVFSVLYARYITILLTSETKMHLSEVATQSASSVQRQIARDFDLLEILADGTISKPEVRLEEKIARIKQQADKFGFFRIALVDLEGNATSSDGYKFSVADREFFQTAVKGKRALSKPIIDKVDGVTPGIVYAVPVFHDGEIVSVLFSGYELEKLTERMNISFYQDNGVSFIADSDAKILLHPMKERIGKNIAQIAVAGNEEKTIQQFMTDLKRGESGVAHLVMREDDRFFAYAPIQGANDWFIFASLPSTIVFDNSQKVIFFTSLLMAIISGFFAVTALYIAISQKKSNAQIIKLAYYDQLTGAANVECFKLNAKELFKKYGAEKYTLLNFDVKKFRYLNNDLGYGAGNEFLAHITHCLEVVAKKGETFARVGTDQFLLLYFSKNNEEETQLYIKRLRKKLANWDQTSGGYYCAQMAFGVYEIEGNDADIMFAIEKSNIARRIAKVCEDSNVAIYDEVMQSKIERDNELEKSMPEALENGEFKLFIQPKYDLKSEEIVGGEALVRWIKPDGKIVMPDDFIRLFEQTNAIFNMDMYMLNQLCIFLRSQIDRGVNAVPISINQSRRYMYSSAYVEVIRGKLRENGVPPQLIELEIIENIVYADIDKLIAVLGALHNEGFRISIDDFGAGYSSLNVLKDLQVDTLKLDRFMLSKSQGTNREKVVVANIIRMAKELDMSVVAEGVETRDQVLFLRECGCEQVQGYYYCEPIPADEFDKLIRDIKHENIVDKKQCNTGNE